MKKMDVLKPVIREYRWILSVLNDPCYSDIRTTLVTKMDKLLEKMQNAITVDSTSRIQVVVS